MFHLFQDTTPTFLELAMFRASPTTTCFLITSPGDVLEVWYVFCGFGGGALKTLESNQPFLVHCCEARLSVVFWKVKIEI